MQIPMAGAIESLNVGVATGISIYELRMRMVMGMLGDRIRATLGRDLTAAANLTREAFDVHLQQVGDLDGTQTVLLMVLACDRAAPEDRLRRDVGIGVEEMSAHLDLLAAQGLVRTDDGPDVMITREGERTLAALWAVQERVEDGLYDGFTRSERQQLRDLLRRVQANASRIVLADQGRRQAG